MAENMEDPRLDNEHWADVLVQALPYFKHWCGKIVVVKYERLVLICHFCNVLSAAGYCRDCSCDNHTSKNYLFHITSKKR